MIASISGTIQVRNERSLVVGVQGIGYEIFVTPLILEKVKVGQTIVLQTHLHVREELMELYGFLTNEELKFFRMLLQVSGIGPKSALAVMSLASVVDLKRAISRGDASLLIKVSGIGTKTAERLIVELKDKLDTIEEFTPGSLADNLGDHQAIDGLVALGYTQREAREALRQVSKEVIEVKDRVRTALKLLGKK
jgi:Holliday junction DNA helicase RuvA